MDNREKHRLETNLAAVHFSATVPAGVAVVIPAGEVIHFDRTAPLLDQMRQVEWNGSSYGVFAEDLRERADKVAHRVDNPGIVSIHPSRSEGATRFPITAVINFRHDER